MNLASISSVEVLGYLSNAGGWDSHPNLPVNNVFPIAQSFVFVPLTMEDFVFPSDNILAKQMALFDRAEIAVIDVSSLEN